MQWPKLGITLGMMGAGAMLIPASTAFAQSKSVMIQAADPEDKAPVRERDGVVRLRASEEYGTQEMASYAFDPGNPAKGVVALMSTGRLDGAAGPFTGEQVEREAWQGACHPVELVQDPDSAAGVTLSVDQANKHYLTQRRAREARAFNFPSVYALGGDRFAVMANWQKENRNNTERYLQVVNSSCELMDLTSNTEVTEDKAALIMAKNNDNCSGGQSGEACDVQYNADGSVEFSCLELCNGNGRDDGWRNHIAVSCEAGTNSCEVTKIGDTSVIKEEERSRGKCHMLDTNADGSADTDFCFGTEGNNQPQREGVWAAAVNHESGDLLWRERVAHREEIDGQRYYAMRIKTLAETDISGAKTGRIWAEFQMHRGNNAGKGKDANRKGGRDGKVYLALFQPAADSLNEVGRWDITDMVIQSKVEMTHATLFQSFQGEAGNLEPVLSLQAGSFNANATRGSHVLNISLAGQTPTYAGVQELQASYDNQLYSNLLGGNPNNQGRNYSKCGTIVNPFVDQPGPTQGIPVFNMCTYTGKVSSMDPAIKLDAVAEIWSSVKAPAAPQTPAPQGGGADPEGTGTPSTPGTPSGGNSDPTSPSNGGAAQPVGGCSAGGAGSLGGSFALMFLGLAFAIRRRRNA